MLSVICQKEFSINILLIVLGAILAVGGSLLAQRNQLVHNKIETDKKIILQIISILLDYYATQKQVKRNTEAEIKIPNLEHELAEYLHQLASLALQITSKRYFGLSVKVTKFSLDKHLRTEENLHWLTRQAQKSVNKELIATYEKEISEFPNKL
jgi:hypothetical protein